MPIDLPQHDQDDARPWEAPGAVRRDCEPHRGHVLRRLATGALVCGLVSLVVVARVLFLLPVVIPARGLPARGQLLVTALLSAPCLSAWALAAAAINLADRDSARMEAGLMDPAGLGDAGKARARAGWALLLTLPGILLVLLVLTTL